MKNAYIHKEVFLDLLDDYGRTKILSDELGKIFIEMTTKMFGMKCFRFYTRDWKKRMQSEALFTCCRYADKFNDSKGGNPHAYFSKVIENSYLKFINDEKKYLRIQENERKYFTEYIKPFFVIQGVSLL